MRIFSFAMESTRYCNYSKDKFNNEITFVIPTWLDLKEGHYLWEDQNPLLTAGADIQSVGYDDSADLMIKDENYGVWLECKRHYENWMETETFMHSLQLSEQLYFDLLNLGWKPQQARQVLPNALKTELVMTGFESDWKDFFALRSPKYGATGVHPDAAYLADKLYDLLYIEKDYDFSLVHHDAFDGECSFLNDGDMITYHSIHDKNKDSYTIESVTITPKDGEVRTLSREEYLKLTNNASNESHLSFKAELLDLSESKTKKSKQQISEEPNNILHITFSDGLDLYMHKDEWKAWKEFDSITKK